MVLLLDCSSEKIEKELRYYFDVLVPSSHKVIDDCARLNNLSFPVTVGLNKSDLVNEKWKTKREKVRLGGVTVQIEAVCKRESVGLVDLRAHAGTGTTALMQSAIARSLNRANNKTPGTPGRAV